MKGVLGLHNDNSKKCMYLFTYSYTYLYLHMNRFFYLSNYSSIHYVCIHATAGTQTKTHKHRHTHKTHFHTGEAEP